MIRRQPVSTRTDTRFPSTTLFRSDKPTERSTAFSVLQGLVGGVGTVLQQLLGFMRLVQRCFYRIAQLRCLRFGLPWRWRRDAGTVTVTAADGKQLGRASCRGSVCHYVLIPGVAVISKATLYCCFSVHLLFTPS